MDLAMIVSALVAVAALVIGIFLGKAIFAKNTEQKIRDAENQANKITEDAKILAETLKEKKAAGGQRKIPSDEIRERKGNIAAEPEGTGC